MNRNVNVEGHKCSKYAFTRIDVFTQTSPRWKFLPLLCYLRPKTARLQAELLATFQQQDRLSKKIIQRELRHTSVEFYTVGVARDVRRA